MQKVETVELYHQNFHCYSSPLFCKNLSNLWLLPYRGYHLNYSLSSALCFLSLKIYVKIILTLPRWWFYFTIVLKKKQKKSKMEIVPVLFQFHVCFCLAFKLLNLDIYVFEILWQKSLRGRASLYHNTLLKCTHLILKWHLQDTSCIAILLGKI